MLDPGTCLGDALVTPLLALGQRFVARALPLDPVTEAVCLQPCFTRFGRIAPVGIDVPARVLRIQDLVEVLLSANSFVVWKSGWAYLYSIEIQVVRLDLWQLKLP